MRSAATLLVLCSLALAGCVNPAQSGLAPGATAPSLDAFSGLKALLVDLPCEAPVVGAETSENMREVANLAYEGGVHGEHDAFGDWLLVARYQDGGFEVVSLADPAAPALAATWQSEEASAYDVKWLPDGRTAVVGHELEVALVDVSPVLDAGLPAAEVLERGIVPELVSAWAFPSPSTLTNMHMLATHRIAGEDYVFVAPNDDTGVWILKVTGEGVDRALETVTNVGAPFGGGPVGPHDMSVFEDELLGRPVLYVANGFEGWMAWDVSDPASPARLAFVPNLDPGQGYTHTVAAAKVGERRIVATVSEVGVNMLKLFDATDFSRPVLLGEWWAEKAQPQKAQHNVQMLDGRLYVAHYAQGVFVFDLTTLGSTPMADTLALQPVAHYAVPEPQSMGGAYYDVLGFQNVWDVVVHRGVLLVGDVTRGTAVVGYGCLTPGDEAQTSVG